jgi:hypothetical protein
VLEAVQSARRAARERAGPRITPGERAVIERAWHLAVAGSYAGRGTPGPKVLQAIRQATVAGAWPEDEVHARIVIAAVLAERTKRGDARGRRLAA